jgi:FkbM family methyltransferase
VGAGTLLVRTAKGLVFDVDPLHYIDSIILREGAYESEVVDALVSLVKAGDVFWDVGANFGVVALSVKSSCPDATVVCFEPNPEMLARLRANASRNDLSVRSVSFALSDNDSVCDLHIVSGNPGMSTLVPWKEARYDSSVLCATRRADVLVQNAEVPGPDVMKVDVEGSELSVLCGGRLLDVSPVRAIVFEAESDMLSLARHELRDVLLDRNFKITMLHRNESSAHNLENFLAVR